MKSARTRASLLMAGITLSMLHVAASAQSAKKACDTLDTIKELRASAEMMQAVSQAFSGQCASFTRVLAMLSRRTKAGGRDLTAPKPLDRGAAAGDIQRLDRDPEFAKAFREASSGETNPIRLQVIKAATLDDFGEYRARDLIVEQLQGQ